jgi:ribosomal protein S27AE
MAVRFACASCGFTERSEPEVQALEVTCPHCGTRHVLAGEAWNVMAEPGARRRPKTALEEALDELAAWERRWAHVPETRSIRDAGARLRLLLPR